MCGMLSELLSWNGSLLKRHLGEGRGWAWVSSEHVSEASDDSIG